jgi:hypothetical protein
MPGSVIAASVAASVAAGIALAWALFAGTASARWEAAVALRAADEQPDSEARPYDEIRRELGL